MSSVPLSKFLRTVLSVVVAVSATNATSSSSNSTTPTPTTAVASDNGPKVRIVKTYWSDAACSTKLATEEVEDYEIFATEGKCYEDKVNSEYYKVSGLTSCTPSDATIHVYSDNKCTVLKHTTKYNTENPIGYGCKGDSDEYKTKICTYSAGDSSTATPTSSTPTSTASTSTPTSSAVISDDGPKVQTTKTYFSDATCTTKLATEEVEISNIFTTDGKCYKAPVDDPIFYKSTGITSCTPSGKEIQFFSDNKCTVLTETAKIDESPLQYACTKSSNTEEYKLKTCTYSAGATTASTTSAPALVTVGAELSMNMAVDISGMNQATKTGLGTSIAYAMHKTSCDPLVPDVFDTLDKCLQGQGKNGATATVTFVIDSALGMSSQPVYPYSRRLSSSQLSNLRGPTTKNRLRSLATTSLANSSKFVAQVPPAVHANASSKLAAQANETALKAAVKDKVDSTPALSAVATAIKAAVEVSTVQVTQVTTTTAAPTTTSSAAPTTVVAVLVWCLGFFFF